MRMSPLQLGLIVAGIVLVVGVLIYNAWQERRIRRRIDSAFRPTDDVLLAPANDEARVEPTFRSAAGEGDVANGRPMPNRPPPDPNPEASPAAMTDEPPWSPPMEIVARGPAEDVTSAPLSPPAGEVTAAGDVSAQEPDPEIECIVTLQPAKPAGAGMLAAGLHARLGKRLRWFGRTAPGSPWRPLSTDTRGEFVEFAACLLLADRNGALSPAQLDTYVRVLSELAPMLPAAMSVPDVAAEALRAETLDRLCADVDVQVGLTILREEPASIPGTRLRGVAEAAGFRLASGGRFEWAGDDTSAVLYTLQNARNEPFTVDTLRLSATHGVVFVLDVPRVPEPARVFDQMKLAAKRMAHTLGGDLVDDNRRPLDDAALVATRQQVQGAADALKACGIEPGSPRALALFGT
jgi:FtsZ-interacting cell division protein ZipA